MTTWLACFLVISCGRADCGCTTPGTSHPAIAAQGRTAKQDSKGDIRNSFGKLNDPGKPPLRRLGILPRQLRMSPLSAPGKRKLTFPDPLFIPDKGAWPELPFYPAPRGGWFPVVKGRRGRISAVCFSAAIGREETGCATEIQTDLQISGALLPIP